MKIKLLFAYGTEPKEVAEREGKEEENENQAWFYLFWT